MNFKLTNLSAINQKWQDNGTAERLDLGSMRKQLRMLR